MHKIRAIHIYRWIWARRIIFMAALFFHATANASDNEAQKVYQNCSDSIVMVIAPDDHNNGTHQGSGVVIGPGRVVTNWHVIEGASRIFLKYKGVNYRARLVADKRYYDLAILQSDELDAKVAAISSVDGIEVGANVYAIGNPRGLELTLSSGLISGKRDVEGVSFIQTSAPISPGSSGGGLFNSESKLIGITTMNLIDSQNLNFAVPIDLVKKFAREADETTPIPNNGAKTKAGSYVTTVLVVVLLVLGATIFNRNVVAFIANTLSGLFERNALATPETAYKNDRALQEKDTLEKYYMLVNGEMDSGTIDNVLWVEANANSHGNENTAKAIYLKLRSTQLRELDKEKMWRKAAEELDTGHQATYSEAITAPQIDSMKQSHIEPKLDPVKITNYLIGTILLSILMGVIAFFTL